MPSSLRLAHRDPSPQPRRHHKAGVLAPLLLWILTGPLAAQNPSPLPSVSIDPSLHHLGDSVLETFAEVGVPAEPEGTRIDWTFTAPAYSGTTVLELRQRDFDNAWFVDLNGTRLFELRKSKADSLERYIVPADVLKEGENQLSLVPSRTTDDVIVGEARLILAPLAEVLRLRGFRTVITDENGNPLPCRITITDPQSRLVEIYDAQADNRAVRTGIVYTGDGRLEARLPAGRYILWASHGPEWSRARKPFSLRDDQIDWMIDLGPIELRREVDTSGWISCDAHLHTLQFSGHGDASAMERVVTLAGEEVDLAIATDHNHQTDYGPFQEQAGLTDWFTPVIGNEVTTPIGHINAFPFQADTDLPPYDLRDFVQIVEGIRERGAKVAILNHPRWPAMNTGPFGVFKLRAFSGDWPLDPESDDRRRTLEALPFDGIELVNSTTLENGILPLLSDWFALRNSGHGLLAFGTSDSHTVADVVGQSRTYVRSSTDDPAAIDVDEVIRNIHRGEASVSMGMFCDVQVDDAYGQGDLVPCADGTIKMRFRVQAPSWVNPERIVVYVNGLESGAIPVPNVSGEPTDFTQEFELGLPAHDCWVVCAVFGPGIDEPFWPLMRPMTFACTNPVMIDRDLNRTYSSPAEIAANATSSPGDLEEKIEQFDDAVVIQIAARMLRRIESQEQSRGNFSLLMTELLGTIPTERPIVRAFLDSALKGK
ncbi:MAG: CehA/McbA family metallohydrolase [Planctomycetota bacterium]